MSDWLETPYSLEGQRIWVAGHTGMVGSALMQRLSAEQCKILTVSRNDLDLTRQADVQDWIAANTPDIIVLAAAKVGGIIANDQSPADFLYDNLMIEANIIHAAYKTGVKRLLFLGSSCMYPKDTPQPLKEDMLLTGPFEPTNEAYAIAKIAGLKLSQTYRRQYGCDYIAVIPCNLYGSGDTFDLEHSHVIPALMMKAHEAKAKGQDSLEVWGTGTPRREFLHVHDLADALVFLLKNYSSPEPINVGAGQEHTITELAELVMASVGFKGTLKFDTTKPDGMARKLMDSSRIIKAGWNPKILLEEGLRQTYDWYQAQTDLRKAS